VPTFEGAATLLAPGLFRAMVSRERKRSERSRKPLLLMLIEHKSAEDFVDSALVLRKIAPVLPVVIRETDIVGWFELGSMDADTAVGVIETKIRRSCQPLCKGDEGRHLKISFYPFPDPWADKGNGKRLSSPLYSDLFETEKKKRSQLVLKRAIDFVASAVALITLSPIFLLLALIIKICSKGPVFFRQKRVGQNGKEFVFLKFRSMRSSTSNSIHKDYVKRFIAGKAEKHDHNGEKEGVFKITNDPRVTSVGRFIRRTSLDELPQLWNVFVGEMSLVGPRPPIPYELEVYDIWHRRRLLAVKPGITGLWQVYGRSKTTFDEMVRLDLQYSRTWTPLLDLKILLETPRAVLMGDGAC
jgi:lipopolysaccharide/colanic/teichoic acid biosynthesis glycosyltransferase